jgi:hypothetical protein
MIKLIYISFAFRILLSSYNAFYGPIPGAEFDAISFYEEGIAYASYLENKLFYPNREYEYKIGWYYSYFLGILFYFFGFNLLSLSYLSCFFWFLSSLLFLQILKKINIDFKSKIYALLIYCFLFPTSLVYTSVTLREVYLLFFYNLLALLIIKFNYTNKIISKLLILSSIIIIFFFFIIFHSSSIYIITLSIFLLVIYSLLRKNKIRYYYFFPIIIGSIIFIDSLDLFEKTYNLISEYRKGHFYELDFSRAYYTTLQKTQITYSLFSFAQYILINFLNYLIRPFPWELTDYKDIIAIFENVLRLTLLCFAIKNLVYGNLKKKNMAIFNFFVIIYFTSEFVHSQATVNWGSASRHHLKSMSLLIFTAFYSFKNFKIKEDK